MDGILVINKPSGMTSHDVVIKLRCILTEKRVGHTGTLDPDATGVLVVCIGKATRIIQYLDEHEKVYEGTMTFGIETDSMDASGRVTNVLDSSGVIPESVRDIFLGFVGETLQLPPMVSAVKVGGERLYKLARQGKTVDREARKINIYELELTDFFTERIPEIDYDRTFSRADFRVRCSRGTYVRVLASDVGQKLGCGAHLSRLVRTRSGSFALEDSIGLDEIEAEPNRVHHVLQTIEDALAFMPMIFVDTLASRKFLNGVQIGESDVLRHEGECQIGGYLAVYDQNKSFLGVGEALRADAQSINYKPVKVFGNH